MCACFVVGRTHARTHARMHTRSHVRTACIVYILAAYTRQSKTSTSIEQNGYIVRARQALQ